MERLARGNLLVVLGVIGWVATAPAALAQSRPYIGFCYPAGGQQGTTFEVRLGGQGVDAAIAAAVSGKGVTARVVECRRRLNPQETTLLNEQLREIRKRFPPPRPAPAAPARPATGRPGAPAAPKAPPAPVMDEATRELVSRIETRLRETTNRPACSSISNIVLLEVTIAPDAEPGRRELTVSTLGGVSNPLVFHVGQYPEVSRKPMLTAEFQVLGKEALALRKRPDEEVEQRITLPATLNGQIASGEVNRYRFDARKGQKLVVSVEARGLIPFVADAVPGWFQPVILIRDARGKEMAYDDDYRFKPDPVILWEVPQDGEYALELIDAIYRGREDFVYRMTIGEVPFVTSVFPLGGKAGAAAAPQVKGWNLQGAKLLAPPADAATGRQSIAVSRGGKVSNRLPFELDTLPETAEQETNNDPSCAQNVTLPVIVNGRIDRPDDWDVYRVSGKAGQVIVAEVKARRLDSPLDSVLKVTDASRKVLAFNDDREDPEAGTNTQDADSYLTFTLPADGYYFVHIGDTARHGGEEYAYRLRIGPPQPDFSLRVIPTSVTVRSRGTASIAVQVLRKDGFSAPIKLALKDPPPGFTAAPVTVAANQPAGRLAVKTTQVRSEQPVSLVIEGTAALPDRTLVRRAVPVEDRMQAFLWRHMVPAQELRLVVYDPSYQLPPKRVPRVYPPTETAPGAAPAAGATAGTTAKPATGSTPTATADASKQKFTKQQVASRLRQLKLLFEEGLLTDDFYHVKVLECEAAK